MRSIAYITYSRYTLKEFFSILTNFLHEYFCIMTIALNCTKEWKLHGIMTSERHSVNGLMSALYVTSKIEIIIGIIMIHAMIAWYNM